MVHLGWRRGLVAVCACAVTVLGHMASLSQEVALGLGNQAGEARLRAVFEEAGYSQFRRATETPLNMILEARP